MEKECFILFVVISKREEKGLFLRKIFHRKSPILSVVPVGEEGAFYIDAKIDLPITKGHIKELRKRCPRYSNRIIKPEHMDFPEENRDILYRPEAFDRYLACYGLGKYCENFLGEDKNSKHLVVVDIEGRYAGLLDKIISCCGIVTVVTGNSYKYERESQKLLKEKGVGIIISPKIPIGNMDVVFAPGGTGEFAGEFGNTPVVAPKLLRNEKDTNVNYLTIVDYREIHKILPTDVSAHIFTAALFELTPAKIGKEIPIKGYKIGTYPVIIES